MNTYTAQVKATTDKGRIGGNPSAYTADHSVTLKGDNWRKRSNIRKVVVTRKSK